MINSRGVTLVELMVVLSIAAILAVALGFSYVGWHGAYKVEGEIKTLYSALLDARQRAMQTNQNYFMDISTDGRFYRITQDDSNGIAKVADGDGIFQEQATWAAIPGIQALNPLSWGAVSATKDTTVTMLSRRIGLSNKAVTVAIAATSPDAAGLLSARGVAPGTYGFVLGFDKRGMIRNMNGAPPVTNIGNSVPFPLPTVGTVPPDVGLSICIFTDYDNKKTSDYNPDYDCINIMDTKISLGKLTTQNTATPVAGPCDASNCISK